MIGRINHMKPILGIFLGEASGVGPEIVARLAGNGTLQKYWMLAY